ncbi:MAG TPA: pyridoxal phosphate-dependent aminotransferase [Streptosporangiaceae bacterium]
MSVGELDRDAGATGERWPTQARAGVEEISPHLIRRLAESVSALPPGLDVLPLWYGEGLDPTPEFIRAACERALRAGETFYTPNFGIGELRAEIAAYHARLGRRAVDPGRVVVTSAGVSALALVNQCLIDPGSDVVAVSPVWPNAFEGARVMGGVVTHVPLRLVGDAWRLDLDELFATVGTDTRILLLNSPNNPTGWTMTTEEQRAVLAHCRRTGTWIVADEVYERLYYGPSRPDFPAAAPSFLDISEPDDRLIVCNSFSKAWAMTGWRLGWMVVPPGLLSALAKIVEFNVSCATTFVQYGGIAALRDGEEFVTRQVATYRAHRDAVVPRLAALPGVRVVPSDGAFYAFFSVAGEPDTVALADRLLRDTGVGLAPGAAFGPTGEGYLRMCLAAPEPTLLDAVDRLAAFLG